MDTIYNDKGCFYRALDDEPVFVLLARDPCFAETVRWWVTLRQALIGRGEKPLDDHAMLAEALATAQAGVVWRDDATDMTKWRPERWKVEPASPRELVETGEIDRLRDRITDLERQIEGSHTADGCHARRIRSEELPEREGRLSLILEKRIATYDDDAEVTIKVGDLRRIITEETISAASQHTADTLKATLTKDDASPIRLDMNEIAGRLEAWCGDKDTPKAEEGRQMAKDLRNLAIKVMPLPFIAYDLAGRIAGKLRELVVEYGVTVNSTTWPDTRKRQMMGYASRLEAMMTELFDGRLVADRLQSRRPLGKSPLLGEPYKPSLPNDMGAPHNVSVQVKVLSNFRREHEASGIFRDGAWHFITAMGEEGNRVIRTEPMRGNPLAWRSGPDAEWVSEDIYSQFAGPTTIPETIEEIERSTGYRFDGEAMRAPSDTLDVTDTPDMPPHRFTMFTKSKGWAYGRGLEINPSHIPDMLDRMEADGYTLVSIIGGVTADKVGMIFQRGPRYSAFEIAHGFGQRQPEAPESDNMCAWRRGDPLPTYRRDMGDLTERN